MSFAQLLAGGGQASFGALLGLLFSLLIFFHCSSRVREAVPAMDVVVPGVALYQGMARLGCFAAGCCHGTPAPGLTWAVTFTDTSSACRYLNVPLHPAQLYLAGGNLLLAGVLTWMALRPSRFRGYLFGSYLVGYGMLRFIVEFVRGDLRPFVGPLSLNQWLCAGFAVAGVLVLAYRREFETRNQTGCP
jgi:phosphatidylglycerol:prolipoprotein diacylglycerol transferase